MELIRLHSHTRAIKYVTYNPEGDLLFTCSMDFTPLVWNSDTGALLGSYEGHSGCIWSLDVNNTSTLLLSGAGDQLWKLWDVRTGVCYASVEMHTPIKGVQFAHGDEHMLAITDHKYQSTPSVNIFHLPNDPKTSKTEYNAALTIKNESNILYATWGPSNDTIYFTTEDGCVSIADVSTGTVVLSKKVHTREIFRLRWDPEFLTPLTSSADSSAKLLDGRNLETITTYEYEKGKFVFDAVMAPKASHVVIAGGDDPQSVTNTRTNHFETSFMHKVSGHKLGSVAEHFGPVNALSFHPHGKGFTSGGEDGLVIIHKFGASYKFQPGVDGMEYQVR